MWCALFQEHLDKAVELRVALIGGRVFAAAVDSQALERAGIDWRKAGDRLARSWTPYALPADIAARLLAPAARLGLSYGAADIVVTPGGRPPPAAAFSLQSGTPAGRSMRTTLRVTISRSRILTAWRSS